LRSILRTSTAFRLSTPKWEAGFGQPSLLTFEFGMGCRSTVPHRLRLSVAAQFEFTISQIDSIGYWIPAATIAVPPGGIVRGGKLWRPGLEYEHFESGVLDLARLKTGKSAQFDIAEYPLFQLALSSVPEAERRGPVVTDSDGDPVRYRVFYDMYRDVADAAGVPKEVWNARARHGGGTEARASGASIEDTTDHMQKTDMEGTRRDYIAGNVETTRRVIRSRVASRPRLPSSPTWDEG
jgi:hypothetical protein